MPRLVLVALTVMAGKATMALTADGRARAAVPSRLDADDPVAHEVVAVIEEMASRWGSGRRQTIVSDFWDATDPQVMYLAGEQPDWFIGTAAIEAYLAIRPNATPSISSYDVAGLRVRPMGRDQAIATWNLDFQFQRGTLPAMRERLRASAMLRRTSGGWKFFYYAESPKSSMTYLRELYETIVTPEFKRKVEVMAPPALTHPR